MNNASRLYSLMLMSVFFLLIGCSAATMQLSSASSPDVDPLLVPAKEYLNALSGDNGIGVREPGTAAEVRAADYIQQTFEAFGYSVDRQSFGYINRDTKEQQRSQNIIAYKKGTSGKSIVLGAHYDSTSGERGSLGAVDNGASIAIMLATAKLMAELEQQEYGVTFIAFGAEEVGLQGAYKYVEKASNAQLQSYVGMINLDGIVGSDNLYIHSAHTTPYTCKGDSSSYKFSPNLRKQLFKVANKVTQTGTFQIHVGFEGYPSGETGGWTDHAPFACAGIPIGNFESTNFAINGRSGQDGYSQSTHPSLWTCFDEASMGACDRESEKKWGGIWHTGNDRLDVLNTLFPGRIDKQMNLNLSVLRAFFTELDNNINDMMLIPEQ
jgi:putative aminopeptidase FrvX